MKSKSALNGTRSLRDERHCFETYEILEFKKIKKMNMLSLKRRTKNGAMRNDRREKRNLLEKIEGVIMRINERKGLEDT